MIIVNNELYDANAVGEGGIPAVALVGSLPPALVGVGVEEAAGSVADAVVTLAFSAGACTGADGDGACEEENGFDEENWMPP